MDYLDARYVIYTVLAVVYLLYLRFARRRWRTLLNFSFDYHRHHLVMLRGDPGVNQRSREMATGMLWIIEKQLPRDEADGKINFRGFLRSMLVGGTSLQLVGETWYQIYRYRYDLDVRIPRLLITLSSTLYRVFYLNSWVMIILLPWWDVKLLCSFFPAVKGGPMGLFRDLYRDCRQSRKKN